jgi:hypothetical protein
MNNAVIDFNGFIIKKFKVNRLQIKFDC